MAELFKEALSGKFEGVFKAVAFAIFDDHNSKKEHNIFGNVSPFAKCFRMEAVELDKVEKNDNDK